jgi:hypothetical protein
MATDHKGREVHAGKRTFQEMQEQDRISRQMTRQIEGWGKFQDYKKRNIDRMPDPKNQMSTMPSPGIAVEYPRSVDPDAYVATDFGYLISGGMHNSIFNNPKTGQPYPEPVAWDFGTDSPKQKSKGVPKPKKAPTEEEVAKRDMFW